MITIFGIHNCDTVKKTRKWLDNHKISYSYHDIRKDGFDRDLAQRWSQTVDHNVLINKRSTTWKQLSETQKLMIDGPEIVTLILEHPTLIKRPVIETRSEIFVGYNESQLESLK